MGALEVNWKIFKRVYGAVVTAVTRMNTNNNNNSTIAITTIYNVSFVNASVVKFSTAPTKENTDSCFSTSASNYNNTPPPPPIYVHLVPTIHSAKMYNEFMDLPKLYKHCASDDKKKIDKT